MKLALHTWGVNPSNAGDMCLDYATKYWFKKYIDSETKFVSVSCRGYFDDAVIDRINKKYDYLIVGGGGLILPDTNPNSVSCWQWKISTENIKKIKIPIYVIGIGYNLFYNQTISMPRLNSNYSDSKRLNIFNKNISTLIDRSELFSVRHNGDIELLKQHVPKDLHNKMKFNFCPTIEYVKNYAQQTEKVKRTQGKPVWAFEIKQDRLWRRYHKTSRSKFLNDIYLFIKKYQNEINFKILLHEPYNRELFDFLKHRKIDLPIIVNYNITLNKLVYNFQCIDRLYCMAGHSQMLGHALGVDVRSIVTHDKLKFFLQDIGQYKYSNYIDPNSENVYEKLLETI